MAADQDRIESQAKLLERILFPSTRGLRSSSGQVMAPVVAGLSVIELARVPDAGREALLVFATEGDWTTPTCPSCAVKMTARGSARVVLGLRPLSEVPRDAADACVAHSNQHLRR